MDSHFRGNDSVVRTPVSYSGMQGVDTTPVSIGIALRLIGEVHAPQVSISYPFFAFLGDFTLHICHRCVLCTTIVSLHSLYFQRYDEYAKEAIGCTLFICR